MKTKQRPNREAVARSLRELEILFGMRTPENEIAADQSGEVGANHNKLRSQYNTFGGAA